MDNITVYRLKTLIPKVKIIDVRDNYQYNLGSIPTAKNIPANFLTTNPDVYLNFEDTYYIYCEFGNTSSRVCEILKRRGYNVVNVIGGYNEYKRI